MPRITIIEDDEAVNEALCVVLERSGYTVTTFLDDREFQLDEHSFPDLFIIDRHLMGIDGIELCRRIKLRDDSAHTPVIMISGVPGIEPMAYAAGADHFLEKPFSKKQLLDSIESLLMKES